MKKFGLFLIAALTAAAFSSCNESDGDYYDGATLVTVIPLEGGEYFFRLDDGKTIYPGINNVSYYKVKEENQRAIIYYKLLNTSINNYDYNVKLYGIEDILTKNAILVDSQEKLDEVGDDGIDIKRIWIGDGYLNIFFEYPHLSNQKHFLNIIENKINPPVSTPNNFLTLEFRHNAYKDTQGIIGQGAAAFKIDMFDPDIYEGIYLRVKTLTGDITYLKLNFSE